VIRDELRRLMRVEERHRRLLSRLVIAGTLSALVFALGTVLVWAVESGRKGGDIQGFGDSAFFTAVQLLSVSSSINNPITPAGRIIDIGLEVWAVFVVTAVAGSFASFFSSGEGG
jgi:low affinity Fe/Cu permease